MAQVFRCDVCGYVEGAGPARDFFSVEAIHRHPELGRLSLVRVEVCQSCIDNPIHAALEHARETQAELVHRNQEQMGAGLMPRILPSVGSSSRERGV